MPDTIVIGSGAGGLTAAVALAGTGREVLVLEQHTLPGGWCHSFPLQGHLFSPGVHYLGELGEGGRLRRIYEGLGVSDELVFCELNPDGFDHARVGQDDGGLYAFDYCKGQEAFTERLCAAFPDHDRGIRHYLHTISGVADGLGALTTAKGPLDLLRLPVRSPDLLRWGFRHLQTLLDRDASDPLLQALLSVQSGDNGLPPSQAPVLVHAAVMAHYFDGGAYPMGGARALPRAFIKVLRRRGGSIRVGTPVQRILLDDRGAVRGVRLQDGEEIRCPEVISNADPEATWRHLVGLDNSPPKVRRKLDKTRWSATSVSLFMAAELDTTGLDSGNYWYAARPDLERIYGHRSLRNDDPLPGMFLTITSLKDPTKRRGKVHTLEAFTMAPWDDFAPWDDTRHGERPDDYIAFKDHLRERMIDTAERLVPGLRDGLVMAELGTPLTNQHYVSSFRGNMYGTEKTRDQLGPLSWPTRTAIPGLSMCGASTTSHGVMGATMSGLTAASQVAGVRIRELLSAEGAPLRIVPSDHPERWPEDLLAKLP